MATSKPKPPTDDDAPALDLPDYLDPAVVTTPGESFEDGEWRVDSSGTRSVALMAAAAFKASANISVADLIATARELEPYLNGTDATETPEGEDAE